MILHHPIPGARLSDGFGPRDPIVTAGGTSGSFHYGQDYAAKASTPILAAADGQVTVAYRLGTYGFAVYLDHGDGLETRYAHMIAAPPVGVGWHVSQGDVIGYVGSTGASTGPHLHFETLVNGERIDPLRLLTAPPTKGTTMATMIRTPDGTIAFVSGGGMLDPISDLQEVEALKASGLVSGWVQQPDGLVFNLLTARTKRLQEAEAARLAAAIKATQ